MNGRRFQWAGRFEIRELDTGREWTVDNDILADGIEMTMALWAGDTGEHYHQFRLEDSNGDTVHDESVDITFEVDESVPRGEMTSRALVPGSAITSAIATIAVVGTLETVIARASVALDAGQAYEIKRIDYLAESADVLP